MKLHSTILGAGKPFLILHGFLGMSDNWKTLGKKFSEEGYEVHLLDQRNHGRSSHSEEFNFDVMASDVKEYCDLHDLENIMLLGHSLGGKTAMFVAANSPELLEKLIIVDIAPRYYAPHHQEILKGLKMLEDNKLKSRGEAEELLKEYVPDEGTRLFLLKNLYWKTKEKLALRLNLKVLAESGETIGKAFPSELVIDQPTLFIKGTKSNYISEKDVESIKKIFPNSEIIEISEAGHWVHAEKPEEFLNATIKFLSN